MHGGGSKNRPVRAGADHPNWKGGKRSRYVDVIGANLGQWLLEHADDPELDSLSPEMALIQADNSRRLNHLSELRETMSAEDWALVWAKEWPSIRNNVETLGRLARTQHVRTAQAQENMTAREAATLFGAIQQAVLDVVTDDEMRRQIAGRIRLILAAGRNNSAATRKLLTEATAPAADAEYEVVDEPGSEAHSSPEPT